MTDARTVHFTIELGEGLTAARADVRIYAISEAEPRELDHQVVRGSHFTADLPEAGGEYLYAVAEIRAFLHGGRESETGERTFQLISVFEKGSERVALSEPVTVATAYSFCRFLRVRGARVEVSDPHRAAGVAYAVKGNFVGVDGVVSRVIRTSPNGLETNGYALFNSLSNLTYRGLAESEVYAEFLRLMGASSFFEGLHRLARDPFTHVEAIYALSSGGKEIYSPSLPSLKLPEGASPVPDQWTLTVKRNDSGAENFMIAGVGYAAFDKNDRAWLTNNVRQGTPNSSTFCVVLEPDGSPAPFSPLFGGGSLGAGFGVATDPAGETIYLGNFGWGPAEWNPQHGSVSVFDHQGHVLSPPNGYTHLLSRVQGVACDRQGNLWMCSWGSQDPMPPTDSRYNFESQNSAIVVYLEGDPERALIHSFDSPYHLTFDVAFDAEGNAYVSNSGSGSEGVPSSVHKFRIEGGELRELACWKSHHRDPKDPSKNGVETFRQVTVSPGGDVFVVAVETSRVIRLSRDLEYRGELTHNIHGPWGITFDPEGTMYVANFSHDLNFGDRDSGDGARESAGPFGVTVIRDGDERTAKLMTLPTGGEEVTLANGLPLYGNPQGPHGHDLPVRCYDPLMRLTGTRIDRAGNLWALNNWKPSVDIDVLRGDPGGDGVVIFVGAAHPEPRRVIFE